MKGLVTWVLIFGGIILAAINGKYFGAYSDPSIRSLILDLLTIVMIGTGLILYFLAKRKSG